jgi:hypothetical protein
MTTKDGGAGNPGAARPATPGRRPARWPLLVIGAPAVVAVWTGWVGLAGLAGFGLVEPLPGITPWELDTRITLPVGMEAYAVVALHHATGPATPLAARRWAGWTTAAALLLGLAGQIAYHLLTSAGQAAAPWPVTILVSSVPVLALGAAAMLWHLLGRPDQAAATLAATPLAAWPDADQGDGHPGGRPAADRPATWPPPARLHPAPLGDLARMRARAAFPLPGRPPRGHPAARSGQERPPLALVDGHPATPDGQAAEDDAWSRYDQAAAAGQPWTWRQLADALGTTPDAARGRARRRAATPRQETAR